MREDQDDDSNPVSLRHTSPKREAPEAWSLCPDAMVKCGNPANGPHCMFSPKEGGVSAVPRCHDKMEPSQWCKTPDRLSSKERRLGAQCQGEAGPSQWYKSPDIKEAYSPAERAVDYIPVSFVRAFGMGKEHVSPYQGWPNEEKDKLWEDMYEGVILMQIVELIPHTLLGQRLTLRLTRRRY